MFCKLCQYDSISRTTLYEWANENVMTDKEQWKYIQLYLLGKNV